MSYLTLAKGIPNFSKAVISLWFRVPKESVDAAREEPFLPELPTPTFFRKIPLLSFGKEQKGKGQTPKVQDICLGGAVILDTVGWEQYAPWSGVSPYPLDPCFIALNCDHGTLNPTLVFNIQVGSFAIASNVFLARRATSYVISYGPGPGQTPMPPAEQEYWRTQAQIPGSGVHLEAQKSDPSDLYPTSYVIQMTSTVDYTTEFYSEQPEFFQVQTVHRIEPDKWHHLLLSFDVSKPVTVAGPAGLPVRADGFANYWDNIAKGVSNHAMLWYAIDDVDYRGRATDADAGYVVSPHDFVHHLGPYSVDFAQDTEFIEGASPGLPNKNGTPGGDPNGILTARGFAVGTSGGSAYLDNFPIGDRSYHWSPTPLPTIEAEMGLPSSARYVDDIYRVEMAEFQMWTGVTLDSSKESNRRAFVDADGKPVNPIKPANPNDPDDQRAAAEKLLGKKPDVLLHGSSNWTIGYNTGTTGIEIETDTNGDEKIVKKPEGQFKPTAKIERYKPDPSLEEETA